MNSRSQAPKGRFYPSPGQRPGYRATRNSLALKGRPIRHGELCLLMRPIWPAPTGLESLAVADPGRCPGLAWGCPVGAQKGVTA